MYIHVSMICGLSSNFYEKFYLMTVYLKLKLLWSYNVYILFNITINLILWQIRIDIPFKIVISGSVNNNIHLDGYKSILEHFSW